MAESSDIVGLVERLVRETGIASAWSVKQASRAPGREELRLELLSHFARPARRASTIHLFIAVRRE